MAAQARTVLLCLAALCLPAFANVPKASLLREKPRQGVEGFALASHQGLATAKPLIAPGIAGCLCDEGRRSRSTGKERDGETGLDYFGARYMSAAQGRFTSADAPFADQFVEDPQSWNLYAYTRNNPLRYIDDDGRGAKEFLYGMFNATSTNAVGGIGRAQATHPHERLGQRVGDAISIVGGGIEMAFGGGLAGGGGGACATGVGCVVGAPAIAGGIAIAGHGALTTATATANLMQASDDAPGSSGSSEPLVGSNPREAKGRTNTDLAGGHKAATDKFGELTKGQKTVVDPKSGHRVAADGTRLRLNPDGTARVDVPKSTNRPKHETVHFNDPDKLKQP